MSCPGGLTSCGHDPHQRRRFVTAHSRLTATTPPPTQHQDRGSIRAEQWTPDMVAMMIALSGERATKQHRRGPVDIVSWSHVAPGARIETAALRTTGSHWTYYLVALPHPFPAVEPPPPTRRVGQATVEWENEARRRRTREWERRQQMRQERTQTFTDPHAMHEAIAHLLNTHR